MFKKLTICNSQFTKILSHLKLNRLIEIVGIGIGSINENYVYVRYVELCRNIARDPQHEFLADPLCFYNIYRIIIETGEDIATIIHSHVGDSVEPSAKDLSNMRIWGIPWIILNSNGVYRTWILDSNGKPMAIETSIVEC